MLPVATEEGGPGLVDEGGHLGRLRRDRQGAGHDAAVVAQVADQAPHEVGLLIDDTEELQHLGRVGGRRGAQHSSRGALDRNQWRAELVAHHTQELGPHALHLLQRRQVLQGDHHRFDRAVRCLDRGCVDQGGDATAVGHGQRHLLGANRLGAAHLVHDREFR